MRSALNWVRIGIVIRSRSDSILHGNWASLFIILSGGGWVYRVERCSNFDLAAEKFDCFWTTEIRAGCCGEPGRNQMPWRSQKFRGRLSRMDMREGCPAQWIQVEVEALNHNLKLFRERLSSGTDLLAVVKANSYGCGLTQMVSRSAARSVSFRALHCELRSRRASSVFSPLVLGRYSSLSRDGFHPCTRRNYHVGTLAFPRDTAALDPRT